MQGAQLRKHIDATLGSGNLREAVKLPPGEDLNEWLAVNSNYFFSVMHCLRAVYSLVEVFFCLLFSSFLNYIFIIYTILKCSKLTSFFLLPALQLLISSTRWICFMVPLQSSVLLRIVGRCPQDPSMAYLTDWFPCLHFLWRGKAFVCF